MSLSRTSPKGCPKHHGHKGDPGVTPGTCGAGGERAQVVESWGRDKRLVDGGRGALPKVLEAYMGEVVWLHLPEAKRQGLHGHWPNVKA